MSSRGFRAVAFGDALSRGRSLLQPMIRWQAGRPERGVFLWVLFIGSGVSLAFALLPVRVVEGILGVVLPSSGKGSTVRATLLDRHVLVFGAMSATLVVCALAAPRLLEVLARALGWLTRLRRRTYLVALCALALGIPLALVDRMLPIIPGQDTGHYFQLANTLLDEGRYIEYGTNIGEQDDLRAWRPPAYPAALSVVLFLLGRRPEAVVVLNAIWMLVLALSVYGLVRHLASEREARLAGLACVAYPTLVVAGLSAMSELQFASLLALGTYLLFGPHPGVRRALLGGVVIGLTALTRGNGLLLFPVFAALYPLVLSRRVSRNRSRQRTRRTWLLPTAALLLGFVLTTTPWVVRNRLVTGHWVGLGTSGGFNMWIGHHPGGTGLFLKSTRPPFPEGADEVVVGSYGTRESLKYWIREPVENLRIGARIVVEILKVDSEGLYLIYEEDPGAGEPGRRAFLGLLALFNGAYYAIWAIIAVWALAAALGKWPSSHRPAILVFVALLYVATYVPFVGWSRYKIPALPFLIAAACVILGALAVQAAHPVTAPRAALHPGRSGASSALA